MKSLGKAGEDLACDYYKSRGYKLVEKNYIFPKGRQVGEIDLILSKETKLVFVEVKTRTNSRFGSPFEAVDLNKQRKLVKMAKLYLFSHPNLQDCDYRIDVAGVDIDNAARPVIILENAIEDLD